MRVPCPSTGLPVPRLTMMNGKQAPALLSFTRLVSLVLAIAGSVIIYGWYANLPMLVEVAPGVPPSTAHTGAVLIMGAMALVLQERLVDRRTPSPRAPLLRLVVVLLALAMMALGLAALIEHAANIDLGTASWFPGVRGPLDAAAHRMTVPASVCALLAGLALMFMNASVLDDHNPAQYLAIIIVGFMAVPLIGFLFSVTAMMRVAAPAGVGPLTATLFILFGFGLVSVCPRFRVMALWNSSGPGAALVRRLLPKSLLLLLLLFLMVDRGARLNLYSYEKVSPLVVLLAGAWLSVLFWRAGAMLNREYEERRSREVALSETSRLLRAVSDNTPDAIYVKDRQGRIVFANPATARMLGMEGRDLYGLSSSELFGNEEDARQVDRNDRQVMESGQPMAIEEPIHTAAGVRFSHSTKAPWLDSEGRVQGVVGISTDITERKRVEDALRDHEMHLERLVQERTAEVSELIGHLETTREEEKRAIARELHDDLGSALTALSMHLAILFQKMPADPALAERIQQIKTMLASVTQTTRRIQVGLRPDKLDVFGIKTAISEQCLEFEHYSGIRCHVDLPDEDVSYAPATEIGLYRMVQESLNNVAKHAQATRVDVVLDDSEDGIVLSVRDNGIGFAPEAAGSKLTHGLRGLRERAQYLGGSARINSIPGKGTSVVIRLPRTSPEDQRSEETARGTA